VSEESCIEGILGQSGNEKRAQIIHEWTGWARYIRHR